MKLKLKSPLKIFSINQPFGANFNTFYAELGMKGHNGIDFYALDSTEVYATHDGRVTFAGYDGAGGLGVVIRTEEKFDFQDTQAYYKTVYWHLKKGTIKVTGGQTVKAGTLIGLADNTGRSTGSHLHFGLKPIEKGEEDWVWFNLTPDNGYLGAINPFPYFELTFSKTLRLGDKGQDVRMLQMKLEIPWDGVFGPKTLQAVKDFQKKHGLSVDGVVGPKTLKALNEN